MKDPLNDFEWNQLYEKYDAKCSIGSRFNPSFSCLSVFQPEIASDRQLYYTLLNQVEKERNESILISLPTYEAIVYWKMYSTSPHINNEIRKNQALRIKLNNTLSNIRRFPVTIDRANSRVIGLVKSLLRLELYGMKLPVATTVMHFLYPDVVPIFDQMILRAVGYNREDIKKNNLNQSLDLYEKYLLHHWGMCKKYSSSTAGFLETSVRVVEMALWVSRGE